MTRKTWAVMFELIPLAQKVLLCYDVLISNGQVVKHYLWLSIILSKKLPVQLAIENEVPCVVARELSLIR